MQLLERVAPCAAGDAAAALLESRLTDTPLHLGGVLSLARWDGLGSALHLEPRHGGTVLLGPLEDAVRAELRRITVAAGRAGYLRLAGSGHDPRRRSLALDRDPRLQRFGDVVVRAQDRGSGLAGHVVRMLVHAPGPLTIGELYEGLERYWRFRPRLLPDVAVMEAWICAQSWLSQAATGIEVSGELDERQLVVANNRGTAQLAALVAGNRTATWRQVIGALTDSGMGPQTAKMAAHTSVVLVHAGTDAYVLRGYRPDH